MGLAKQAVIPGELGLQWGSGETIIGDWIS